MKHALTVSLAVTALLIAATAQADDNDSGLYLGGGVGQFNIKVDDFDDVTTAVEEYDSDDTAWKAFAGWRMNRYFGVELAYINLGSPNDEILPDTFVEIETDGFAPYAVGTLPLGPFELFAKAGYFFHETDARLTTPLGTFNESDSGEDFTWSAGVGVTVFETVNLRLEYEQFDIESIDDANALWLTGSFRF